ncbi:MAG: zf-HC2 domain-containing protein [Acidobacteriota bacterium]
MSTDRGNSNPDCAAIEPLLDDLVDGRLSAALQADAEAHLAGCAGCREQLAELEALLAAVDELPHTLEPPENLWPAIAPRLSPRTVAAQPSGVPGWLRQAAAALAFMTLGALLSQILLPGWESVGSAPSAPADGTKAELAAIELLDRRADFALAEADYLRAKEALWSAVYAGRDSVSPDTQEVVERNLRVIDQAIRELRQALHNDPGNPQLENMLLAQHRSEIDLLQRLTVATPEI